MKALALFVPREGNGEFEREARAFAKRHACEALSFRPWNHEDVKRNLLARDIARADLDLLAIFSHGWRTKLQTGHSMQSVPGFQSVNELAKVCALRLATTGSVVLYACSTGTTPGVDGIDHVGGDMGFADTLRDELGIALAVRGKGARGHVDAHALAGHTTRRPFVRRFEIREDGAPTFGVGGEWVVEPGDTDEARWSKWKRALSTDLRFRFPLMTIAQIREELAR